MASISGFPEWLPAQQSILEQWKHHLAQHFQSFCFVPMDTPVVERMSTLLSKGEDSEIYAITRWADTKSTAKPERQLGLRFDLTIPLARYVSEHHGELVFPYRRYHIAPVWRGERPQEGRFRQFYQCDIDTVVQDFLPKAYDGETIFVLDSALKSLNIPAVLGPVHWHLNHRFVLLSWAEYAGIQDIPGALRLIDKSEKIGLDALCIALKDLNASPESLEILCSWSAMRGSAYQNITKIESLNWPSPLGESLNDLKQTIDHVLTRGIPEERIFFSPLLARGLSYYSGITFETKLPNHADLGSICAGGRYDHLATLLDSKKSFPGVGGSIGLSRLFARFIENTNSILKSGDIFIAVQDSHYLSWYMQLGDVLRKENGFRVEVFLGKTSLKNQLKYAQRKGFACVLLANAEEIQNNCIQIKNMETGEQKSFSIPGQSILESSRVISQFLRDCVANSNNSVGS